MHRHEAQNERTTVPPRAARGTGVLAGEGIGMDGGIDEGCMEKPRFGWTSMIKPLMGIERRMKQGSAARMAVESYWRRNELKSGTAKWSTWGG